MRKIAAILFLASCAAFPADQDFNGRWDISVPSSPARAWWLEVNGAGTDAINGLFVGAPGGNMDVIPEIAIRDGELVFAFDKRFQVGSGAQRRPAKGVWRARLVSGKLQGTFAVEGQTEPPTEWIGVRAPVITDKDDGSWREGTPIRLFNGKDLTGWLPLVPGRELGWTVKDGMLTNVARANNLVSEKKFWNFKLRAEFRLAAKSNSGIGLRGRYEVQILDDAGRPIDKHSQGALYSRIPPSVNVSKPAGEWQTYDITLIGRQVTIVLNGTKVIDKGEVEGLTAMGHDPNEGEPGPISLQGDHGPVEFRSLVVTPLTR
jgi:3-keto-disaccharide hydrolase